MKPWMRYALAALGGLVLGIVIAKYTLPPRVTEKVVTKTEWKDRIEWRDRVVKEEGPVRIVTRTRTVPGPAGPTVEVEKIVEKEKVVTKTVEVGRQDTQGKDTVEASKVTDARPWLALEALGALGPEGRWAGAGSVQARLLGPLWLGPGVIKAEAWYFGVAGRVEF